MTAGVTNQLRVMASDRLYISSFQMDPLHLIQLYHEGWVTLWRNMEFYRLFTIIHIHRICIVESTWFLIHIREDPSDILSGVYVCCILSCLVCTVVYCLGSLVVLVLGILLLSCYILYVHIVLCVHC